MKLITPLLLSMCKQDAKRSCCVADSFTYFDGVVELLEILLLLCAYRRQDAGKEVALLAD
jgi:hypothetical protein